MTHILEAPGFNPWNYKETKKTWFQFLLFQIRNVYRYTEDDLIMSLTQQAEHLTQRVQALEGAEKRVEAAALVAESGGAVQAESS